MTGARRPLLLCATVLALASIAGCQGSPPAAGPAGAQQGTATTAAVGATPGPGATAGTGDVPTVWGEFIACARSHGQQAWPDPVFDDNQGAPTFPEVEGFDIKTGYEAVKADCGPILDRLPATANPFAVRPVTAEQLEVVRRYSRCMREHPGMESFPDPDADGSLHIPDELQRPPLLEQQNAARNVCDPILQELLR